MVIDRVMPVNRAGQRAHGAPSEFPAVVTDTNSGVVGTDVR